jgi:hypothetical protein
MNPHLSQTLFWVWILEIGVSGFNYAVLMNKVYRPRYGELRAHQIGMSTRIAYICIFAYFLDAYAQLETVSDYLIAGLSWLLLVLAFEWVGSLILRRPIKEILVGWHIENGYMWPYVLLAYFLSPVLVGVTLNPSI